jgi:hypothetical protein
MRSDLIFPAVKAIRNRFTLCQLAAKATRRFHKPSIRIQQTMNEVLERVATAPEPEQVLGQPEVLAELNGRAA